MKTIQIRNVMIGEGKPKVCIPLIGRNIEELRVELTALKNQNFDLVEWRADFFQDLDEVLKFAHTLRQHLKEVPILFTFRSKREGGEQHLSETKYFGLIQQLILSGFVDVVDVELFMPEVKVKETIALAQKWGVKVIISNHDFQKTPSKEEMIRRLCIMQDLGADVCKIAVMPQTATDVLTLLQGTNEMHLTHATRPIVTMSMGGLGMISRLCGEVFGSAITFGIHSKASASGQIPVEELGPILNLIHENLNK